MDALQCLLSELTQHGQSNFFSSGGGLHKLDVARKPGTGTTVEHTLLEEDEGSPITGEATKGTGLRQKEEEAPKSGFPEVTIAVAGEENAGKTSFVKCALDMKNTPVSPMNKKKMSLNGSVYIVHLMEVDLTQVRFDQDKKIIWPHTGRDRSVPAIDAVLVLHDATKPDRLSLTTNLIDSLAASDLPFLQVACKCDVNPEPLEDSGVDAIHDRYEIYRTSFSSPRSQRMCIALVLGAVISTREAVFTAAGGPQTASDQVDGDGENPLPTDGKYLQHTSNPHRYARSNSQPVRPQTPPSGARLNTRRPSAQELHSPNHDNRQQRLHTAWRHSGGSDAFDSFLNMDDEGDDGQSRPASPGAVVRPKPSSESNSSAETGLSFDELVDRLISLPISKQDQKFRSIFLCLYRKFAAPASLLTALINRFERNETSNDDQLARMADQLRLLDAMAQWASDYPGDFAHPKLRKRIIEFVAVLEKSHFYMFAAKEIGSQLDSNAEDDDVGWAYGGDSDSDEPQLVETFFDNSGRSSPAAVTGAGSITNTYDTEEEQDPIYSMSALDLSSGPHDSTSRLSVSSNTDKSNNITTQSFTLLNLEAAQKEALRLELTHKTSLSKLQWRFFMGTPEEEFARELTRIDWIMYNSFRPRDLVRHVSLSGIEKDKVKSLTNVNRMIKQFNHLAFFVASLILLRDKPKHRAQALEKFMNIAVKLRRQNNYNSLGAVIAAINGTPVHRLTQTRDLIPIQTQKEFMRLVILMSTQRSHFAYRLAWENSFSERIPFLPLHRRDLVSAEEGNKTFVGENKSRINWKKFEVMGEVVLGIQRSQKTPHPQAQKFDDVERLILDSKLSGDEEDLYARSLLVEPSTGAEGRRKFGWLRSQT
ncbi:hypothetical protein N7489_004385 [Penicillium chrysogenum]|uniref:uncharacterized protein n=1 Tax=Penicillium chrysogenum TaxID=5076 RepID=UPI0024DF1569|nr:uncharacterized protein N7489_004385 [Penicillium chrysogenum]KAJ5244289.1 hypothetical protein N7489_004385 [Penicillium chrysogenum]